DLGGLAPTRLLAARRMVDLRRVDADVADLLDPLGASHVDGVAVDDPDDHALERTRRCGRGRDEGENDDEWKQREAAAHAATVSRASVRCQLFGTPRLDTPDTAGARSSRARLRSRWLARGPQREPLGASTPPRRGGVCGPPPRPPPAGRRG